MTHPPCNRAPATTLICPYATWAHELIETQKEEIAKLQETNQKYHELIKELQAENRELKATLTDVGIEGFEQ